MNIGSEYKIEYKNITDKKSWQTDRGLLNNNLEWTIDRLDPNKEYQINVYYLQSFSRWTKYGDYKIWSTCNTAEFTLNGQSSGTISVCGNEPLIMNAAASKDENGYGIAIREVNAQYQGVGNEMIVHFSGQAPNGIDIRQLAAGSNLPFMQRPEFPLIGGKRYYVKLFTKPNWQEKSIFIDLTPARVSFTPNANLVAGTTDRYVSCADLSGNLNLSLNTTTSTCEVRYHLAIVEQSATGEIAATRFEKWITPFTPLPDQLDVSRIYQNAGFQFTIGKEYRISLSVGFPWHSQTVYVKFLSGRDCAQRNAVKQAGQISSGFN